VTGYLYLGGLFLIVGGAVTVALMLIDWIRDRRKPKPAPAAQATAVQLRYVNACVHGVSIHDFCPGCCAPDRDLDIIAGNLADDVERYLAGGDGQ
jgi:hypothetical protein